jgi:uncharacterized protein
MRIATIFATVLTGMVLAIAGADQTAFAARFDCADAQLPAEQTVCSDPQLSRLDDQYSAKYDSVLGQLPNLADEAKKGEVRDQAQSFLTRRNECETSTDCIRQSYRAILEYFSTVENPSADAPPDTSVPTTSDGIATASPRALARVKLAAPEAEDDLTSDQTDDANGTSASPRDVSPVQNTQENASDLPAGSLANDEPTPDPATTQTDQNSTSESAPQTSTDADTPPPPTVAEASSISSPLSNTRIETILMLLILATIAIYVLPSLVAFGRSHPNRWPILAINIAAGITFFGWLVAMVWACGAIHRVAQERTVATANRSRVAAKGDAPYRMKLNTG